MQQFAPEPPKKKSWFARHKIMTALLAIVLVAIVASIFNKGSNKPAASDAAAGAATAGKASATNASKASAAAPAQKIGAVVHYNTYDFTVKSVKCGVPKVGGEYVSSQAQGQFCLVQMTVKNTGTKEQNFMADDQKLIDAQGREYSYSSEGTISLSAEKSQSSLWFESINPGNTVSGTLVYDLPKGVTPVTLHVSDGGFTDKGTDISLK